MTCDECGGQLHMTDSEGGTTEGPFTERYECIECGARGTIRGEASADPRSWTKTGQVFES